MKTLQPAMLTEVNPEVFGDQDALAAIEWDLISQGHHPASYIPNYSPESHIPDGGCWIIVRRVPNTTIKCVPRLSIWRANLAPASRTKPFRVPGYRGQIHLPPRLAEIVTPEGSLSLFPDEYSVVNDIHSYLALVGDGVTLHRLGGEPAIDPELLFYAQTRGLSPGDVAMLTLHDLATRNYCWFELDA